MGDEVELLVRIQYDLFSPLVYGEKHTDLKRDQCVSHMDIGHHKRKESRGKHGTVSIDKICPIYKQQYLFLLETLFSIIG